MGYGILVAETEQGMGFPSYQIIGAVDSPDEARELANNYLAYGPNNDCLAPDRFVINRRGDGGFYTRRETVEL